MPALTIWSDLTCPWAYVAVLRLHRTRDRLGADEVEFDLRAFPLETTEGGAPGESQVRADVGTLVQLEGSGFSLYEGATWPASTILASEAQKWGFSVGQDIGERFDLALRRGFFLHSHDLGRREELLAVAKTEGLASDDLAAALDTGRFRAAVAADAAEAAASDIEGSPTVVLPDGAAHFNPGIAFTRVRGLAHLEADHPSVYEEIVRTAAMDD